jgi:hypothetical protein
MMETRYPEDLMGFIEFLCGKYGVDRNHLFIEYSSKPPPPVRGSRPGYYDGLLSYREKGGHVEFLITVFRAARDPLLTLGHEFAHLVADLKTGKIGKPLGPPDDVLERKFDDQARGDLNEFLTQKKIDRSERA